MEFQKNDKVLCRILNYIPKERSFEVEDVTSQTKGWVFFINHYDDIPLMKDAFNNHKTIPLYFDRYEEGTPLFKYKLYNEKSKSVSENFLVESESPALTINMSFSTSNSEYNTLLFNALFSAIGESVNTKEKYEIAKQLLEVNRVLKIRQGLAKELFNISTYFYQNKFWSERLIPYCSNAGIRKSWYNANEEGKQIILQRLGIFLPSTNENRIECYFDNIEDIVLRNIHSARTSIYV